MTFNWKWDLLQQWTRAGPTSSVSCHLQYLYQLEIIEVMWFAIICRQGYMFAFQASIHLIVIWAKEYFEDRPALLHV